MSAFAEDEQVRIEPRDFPAGATFSNWRSSDESVATVETMLNGDVVVKGVSPGTCTISVTSDGQEWPVEVEITPSRHNGPSIA